MSEYEYLEALDQALMTLSQAERQEVLDDYRQHFREGRAAGKADVEIAQLLGEPAANAKQYLSDRQSYYQYPYTPPRQQKKLWRRPIVLAVTAIAVVLGIALGGVFQRSTGNGSTTISPGSADLSMALSEATSSSPLTQDGITEEEIFSVTVETGTYRLAEDIKDLDFSDAYSDIDQILVVGNYSLSCTLIEGEGPNVHVSLSGQIPAAHDIVVSISNGKLNIRYRTNQVNVYIGTDTPPQVMITVPKEWGGEVSLSTVAGNILIDEAALTRLETKTTSGNVFIRQQNIQLAQLAIATVSGDVELDLNAGQIEVASASGNVCGRLRVDQLELATASGDVDLDLNAGRIEMATASGDINLTISEISDKAEISTVSSAVELALPSGYGFEYKTLSGRLTNLAGLAKGSAIFVGTVSGDLTLREVPAPA